MVEACSDLRNGRLEEQQGGWDFTEDLKPSFYLCFQVFSTTLKASSATTWQLDAAEEALLGSALLRVW